MGTFLISTTGTHGDVLQFVAIGAGLRARGHEVVLWTHAVYDRTVGRAGLRFEPLDTHAEYARQQADTSHLLPETMGGLSDLIDYLHRNRQLDVLRREYEAMAAVVRDRPAGQVVLLSHHTTGIAVLMVREALGVPAAWAGISPTQHLATPLTHRIFPEYFGGPMNALRDSVGLPPVDDWVGWLTAADLSLGLWPGWFDAAGPPAPGAVLTGFALHEPAETGELPAEVAAAVADGVPPGERPVLVTGGSSRLLHGDWYRVAVEACVRAGRAALVVTGNRDLVPDPLPDRIRWYPALPFATLLPRVPAVLHHGGVLTCARAIASGVPQLLLAHGADRPDNALRLRRLGVAEWLPPARWDPDGAAALLGRVSTEPRYAERARALAPAVDAGAAVGAACDRLEALLGRTPAPAGPVGGTVRDRVRRLDADARLALAARLRARRP